jgi:hypothetical protein
MVDAVLRYHRQKLHRLGERKVDPIFYADDGLLAGKMLFGENQAKASLLLKLLVNLI